MRCLYEVLNVDVDVEEAALRKSYRRLALQWHPDKNAHQADEAHERFQEIQNAWEVLSDPQERAWYNSHREQILCSGSHQTGSSTADVQAESPYPDFDFERYTSRSAFAGFADDKHSFFVVFGGLFSRLAKEEQEAYRRQKPVEKNLKRPPSGPPLGDADAEEVGVKAFYMFWCNFQTIKDYSWLDEYNPTSAPGRRIRRLMEAENEKRRRGGKMAFVSHVRRLTERIRCKDPRMEVFKQRAEEKKAARAEEEHRKRAAEKAAKQAAAAAYQDADWITAGEEEQLAKMDVQQKEEAQGEMFECIVCDKLYKSEKALKNHEASKKHKEQLKKFKQMMKDEDKLNLDDLSLHD